MARKRRSKNFVAIPFDVAITVGTPAAEGFSSENMFSSTFAEDIYCLSMDYMADIREHTAAEGPLQLGVCHGDLTTTEVGECLDAELLDPSDIIARERARRPVRNLGFFHGKDTDENLNNGIKKRQQLKFRVDNGHVLEIWLRNKSGAQLTTGTIVHVVGTLYGRWLR